MRCKNCGETDESKFSAKDVAGLTRGAPKCKACKSEYARKRYHRVLAAQEELHVPLNVRLARQFGKPTCEVS